MALLKAFLVIVFLILAVLLILACGATLYWWAQAGLNDVAGGAFFVLVGIPAALVAVLLFFIVRRLFK